MKRLTYFVHTVSIVRSRRNAGTVFPLVAPRGTHFGPAVSARVAAFNGQAPNATCAGNGRHTSLGTTIATQAPQPSRNVLLHGMLPHSESDHSGLRALMDAGWRVCRQSQRFM